MTTIAGTIQGRRARAWLPGPASDSIPPRMRRSRLRRLLLLTLALSQPGAGAWAEGFLDVQAGATFTGDADLVSDSAGFVTVSPTAFLPSGTLGMRGGYWFEALPWLGLAGDLSYFTAFEDFGGEPARIHVVPLSFLLMLRVPLLRSENLPQGRVQAYGAIGPGVFVSAVDLELPGASDFQGATADAGLDARVGVEVRILRWLGLFAEYRYTSFRPTWPDLIAGTPVTLSTELDSNHILLGAGFHF
jgi:hypothetical protein